LDKLREHKKTDLFYGTTVVFDKNGFAIWFSKQILPAMRKEAEYRQSMELSPVYSHFGLYGYSRNTLEILSTTSKIGYKEYEGLEQLGMIEDGISIKMQEVNYRGREGMYGIDEIEDIKVAEKLILKYGEYDQYYDL
jgi:3-deoxy-manno-octulosonate cytidylyltransferase (CMP-KDO synthetase)